MKKLLLLPIIFFVFACSSDETDDSSNESVESKLFNTWKLKSFTDVAGITYDINSTDDIDLDVFNAFTLNLTKNGTYFWSSLDPDSWNLNGSFLLLGDSQIIFQKMTKEDENVDATYRFSIDDLIIQFELDLEEIDYMVFEKK